jgi:anti-sigma factor RsiW
MESEMEESRRMSQTQHLDQETLYELIDGRLDPVRARRAEVHLWRCEACRTRHEECGALLSSLRWYGADPPRPPIGYWDSFWARWPFVTAVVPSRATRWMAPALGMAASIVLLVGVWWGSRSEPINLEVPAPAVAFDSGWEDDYEFFERATVAVGSVDPLSKGVILASLAEAQ